MAPATAAVSPTRRALSRWDPPTPSTSSTPASTTPTPSPTPACCWPPPWTRPLAPWPRWDRCPPTSRWPWTLPTTATPPAPPWPSATLAARPPQRHPSPDQGHLLVAGGAHPRLGQPVRQAALVHRTHQAGRGVLDLPGPGDHHAGPAAPPGMDLLPVGGPSPSPPLVMAAPTRSAAATAWLRSRPLDSIPPCTPPVMATAGACTSCRPARTHNSSLLIRRIPTRTATSCRSGSS